MKKLISLILILCMACMLIPAMADGTVAGDWYLKIMIVDGTEYDAAAMGYNITMSINEDGTMTMTSPTEPDPMPGTWTLEGDQITITVDDEPASGTVTADSITMISEEYTMIFTQEAPVAITLADTKAAGAAEEFYGSYLCKYVDMEGSLMDITAMGYSTGMTVSESGIEIIPTNDDDMMAFTLGLLALTPDGFEDGALKLVSATNSDGLSAKLELLEDGMIKLSAVRSDINETMTFYFLPAVAAEEPAA